MQESRKLFVDLRTRVPGTDRIREEYRDLHVAYLTRLKEEGKLLMSGGFEDGSGALTVVSVSTEKEAVDLCTNDPFVTHGVFKSNVKAWIVRIYR